MGKEEEGMGKVDMGRAEEGREEDKGRGADDPRVRGGRRVRALGGWES
jgi:hypothetical protein